MCVCGKREHPSHHFIEEQTDNVEKIKDYSRREKKKGRTTRQPTTDEQGITGREREIKQEREFFK